MCWRIFVLGSLPLIDAFVTLEHAATSLHASRRSFAAPRPGILMMAEASPEQRLESLEKILQEMRGAGLDGSRLEALEKDVEELKREIKIATLEKELAAIKQDMSLGSDAPAPPAAEEAVVAQAEDAAAPDDMAAAVAALDPNAPLNPLSSSPDAWRQLAEELAIMETDVAAQLAAKAAADEEAMAVLPSAAALGVDGVRSAVVFYANDGIPKADALLETFEDEAEVHEASRTRRTCRPARCTYIA